MHTIKKILILVLCLCFLAPAQEARAQDVEKVQAIFILNFTKYIQWPATSGEMTIGVFGNSRVLLELNSLAAKKADLKVNIIKIASESEIASCDVIFIPEEQYRNLSTIESAVNGNAVLIVTETEMPIQESKGGIGFYMENNKLKFVINRSHIEDKNMKVSNNLLGLAKVI